MTQKDDIARLKDYNNRLGRVVSELLSTANEIDQDRSFAQLVDRELSQNISNTCEQLITLADSVAMIEHQLKDGQLDEGRRNILATCHAADAISKRMDQLRLKVKKKSASKFDLD